MGIYDFLNKASAAGGDIYAGMKESGQALASGAKGAWSRIRGIGSAQPGTVAPDTSGMRGSAAPSFEGYGVPSKESLAPELKLGDPATLPGNDPAVAERLRQATAKPLNPVEGSDLGKGPTSAAPAVAGEGTAAPSGGAKQPGLPGESGGIRNPNVGPGQASPEAQAFKASRAASAGGTTPNPTAPASGGTPPGAPPEVPGGPAGPGRFGRIGSLVGKGLRGLGVAGAVLGVADAADKAVSGTTPEQRTGQGGPVMGGVMEAYDNATFGQGRKFAHGVKGALTGIGEGGAGLRDRMSNITGGFSKGWNEGAAMETDGTVNPKGAAPTIAAPGGGANTAVPGGEQAKAAGAPQNSGGGIPTLRGATVSPESLIAGTDIPAPGYGAFKRTGSNAPAVGIHAPGDAADEAANARHAAGLSAPARPGTGSSGNRGGVGGAIADLYSAGAQGRAAALNRSFELQRGAQQLKLAEFYRGMQDRGRERNDKLLESHAEGMTKPDIGITGDKPEQHKANVAQQTSQLKSDVNYTAANRHDGKDYGDLQPAELQKILLGFKIRDKVMDSRGNFRSDKMRDYWGASRFDTRDAYSFLPVKVEKALAPNSGAHVFTLGNGNKVDSKAVFGGGFNPFSANEPIDADVKGVFQKAIDDFESGQGKK